MIPRAEHPRPDWEREHWLNLNGAWDFAFSDAAACPELDKTITVPYSWAAPLSGVGEDVKGTGWYRRRARFDAQGRVFLVIGAADYETQVFVNGKLSGDKTAIADVRAAYGVTGPVPMRVPGAEAAIRGKAVCEETVADFAAAVLSEIHPRDSWRASKAFREHIAAELAQRCLRQSICLAGGAF